jgi:uncharacterized protein
MRTSSYVIYVDLPDQADRCLLTHGYTGAYDVVSRPVARFVRSLDTKRAPKPLFGFWTAEPGDDGQVAEPSGETIEFLKTRGYLTELSPEEEERAFVALVEDLHRINLRRPASYILMPTYDCNLRCSYCFQDHMRTDAKFAHLLGCMTLSTADRIFAAIDQIEGGSRTGVTRYGFFGGEPLLRGSRHIVEYLMAKARSRGRSSFWAVTNATELDAFEDLIGPDGIAGLQITLDGPRPEHDRRRIRSDGTGTFDAICANIELALARQATVSVRLNIDRDNIRSMVELAEFCEARGWHKNPRFSIYAAPIRATNGKTDKTRTVDSAELSALLTECRRESGAASVIGRPTDPIMSAAVGLFANAGTRRQTLTESFCSAHSRMFIFDSFGDIYACWERTGDPSVRIGHIAGDGSLNMNEAIEGMWRTRTVASNPVCRKCRYALHCGGGCAVHAFARTGKYHMNHCDGFAVTFRTAIAEAYRAYTNGAVSADNNSRVCEM